MTIHCGDCLDVMAEMEENSIDTIITDPPYGLEFMGKEWDRLWDKARDNAQKGRIDGQGGMNTWGKRPNYKGGSQAQEWHYKWASAALRVAKPGATLLAFGGSRTHHRLMCAIEDAGWEIRDVIMYVYGTGFPKSHNISKAIDKAAGAERQVVGRKYEGLGCKRNRSGTYGNYDGPAELDGLPVTAPATEAAKLWDGWGTALKPAYEPIIVAMKPLDGTFAQNALKWSVAGLWIDGGRISTGNVRPLRQSENHGLIRMAYQPGAAKQGGSRAIGTTTQGRWPANLIHDGSKEVVGLFPNSRGFSGGGGGATGIFKTGKVLDTYQTYDDNGSAARFFYTAKASRKERTANGTVANNHPTVKPLALLRYLCRITKTPTGGMILDPFMGSGSTLIAALQEGREAIGIDISEGYCEIARQRIDALEPEQVEMQWQPT